MPDGMGRRKGSSIRKSRNARDVKAQSKQDRLTRPSAIMAQSAPIPFVRMAGQSLTLSMFSYIEEWQKSLT